MGRVDDNSYSGLSLVEQIAKVYDVQGINKTEVLAASIRDVKAVSDCFAVGANVVTMPPKVFHKMYEHVLTDKGLYLFDLDFAQIVKK